MVKPIQNTFTNKTQLVQQTKKCQDKLSQKIIDHFGINMETQVGYKGKITPMPIPSTLNPNLIKFLEDLNVDWAKHVDK